MPKNAEAEFNLMDRDFSLTEEGQVPYGHGKRKGVSKKELGRLKSKQALAAREQGELEDGLDTKRPRSE